LYENLYDRKQLAKKQISELNLDEELIKKHSGKSTEKLYKELDMLSYLKNMEAEIQDKAIQFKEQIKAEIEYYGYEVSKLDFAPSSAYIITEIDTKYTPKLRVYNLKSGKVESWKCKKSDIKNNPFNLFDIIKIYKLVDREKQKKVDDKWVKTGEFETYLTQWEILK
jgi:DNA polymerase-3 subunit alpha